MKRSRPIPRILLPLASVVNVAIVLAVVCFWWKDILLVIAFFITSALIAFVGIRMKQSPVRSIVASLVVSLLAFSILPAFIGKDEVTRALSHSSDQEGRLKDRKGHPAFLEAADRGEPDAVEEMKQKTGYVNPYGYEYAKFLRSIGSDPHMPASSTNRKPYWIVIVNGKPGMPCLGYEILESGALKYQPRWLKNPPGYKPPTRILHPPFEIIERNMPAGN